MAPGYSADCAARHRHFCPWAVKTVTLGGAALRDRLIHDKKADTIGGAAWRQSVWYRYVFIKTKI